MPKTPTIRLLLIDDSPSDARLIQRHLLKLEHFPVELHHQTDADGGLRHLLSEGADCVLLDYRLGAVDGLEVLEQIRNGGRDDPVVFVTGEGSEMVAAEALKRGAQDYVAKSVLTPQALQRAISNATEKVELARRIQQKQRELEDFASVVAHDLQQPLCAVKGNVELIRDYYRKELDDEGREFVDAAVRMSARMSAMIEGLLTYARAGRNGTTVGPVDLDAVLRNALSALESDIAARRAEIVLEPLPIVCGDEMLLTQLFQNLVSNALKFQRRPRPWVRIAAESKDDHWEIHVEDRGIGIPAEHLESIFTPFKRLHTHKEFEGSGIGLATCKKIVDRLHGAIRVESEVGRGTVFHVELPSTDETAQAPEQPADVVHVAGAAILIADDQPDIVRLISSVLERSGFHTETADSCYEARQKMGGKAYDLLIADILFPGEDGLDLIEAAAADPRQSHVLACSGGGIRAAPGPLLAQALQRGADGVLLKPFDNNALLSKVRAILAQPPVERRERPPADEPAPVDRQQAG